MIFNRKELPMKTRNVVWWVIVALAFALAFALVQLTIYWRGR